MPTTLVGTAYRIDDVVLGPNDIIEAGTTLTEVELTTIDPDDNDFQVTPPSVIFEGTPNETVLSEAEEITFLVDGEVIATESPTYEFVSLETNVGTVFGITFSAGGDTYFLPRNDFPAEGLSEVTADAQIRANDVSFDQLEFGLLPPGATAYEGLVFGSGAIDAPGLGTTRVVIDSDDTPFNPDDSTEIDGFNAEVLVTVSFADGSSLGGVEAFQTGSIDFVNNQNVDTRAFAIDVDAIEAAGQSLETVVDADFESFTAHDLTYADIGFEVVGEGDGGTPPDPEPLPDPEPEVNVILGTAAGDRLTGTEEADVLIGGAGNDKLTGNGGADVFVFGADVDSGARDRDIILDFDVTEDVIALEQGASIDRVVVRGDDVTLVLDGADVDRIIIRDVEASVVDQVVLIADDFLV